MLPAAIPAAPASGAHDVSLSPRSAPFAATTQTILPRPGSQYSPHSPQQMIPDSALKAAACASAAATRKNSCCSTVAYSVSTAAGILAISADRRFFLPLARCSDTLLANRMPKPETSLLPADPDPAAAVRRGRLAGPRPARAQRVALLPHEDLARPLRPHPAAAPVEPHRHRGKPPPRFASRSQGRLKHPLIFSAT